MIIEYHRPETLKEALELLARQEVTTLPMGGGTRLNQPSADEVAVVDLQLLGLDAIERRGSSLIVGATTTLQTLMDYDGTSTDLKKAIRHEASTNLRHIASVAGTIMAADGRSALATALLALDTAVDMTDRIAGDEQVELGDLLPLRRERMQGQLITRLVLPLNARLVYEYVARTPADLAILSMAVARWPSGRTRLAVGGFGSSPRLAMDGPEGDGAAQAASDACAQAQDEWASAEYRREIAAVLAKRCIERLDRLD